MASALRHGPLVRLFAALVLATLSNSALAASAVDLYRAIGLRDSDVISSSLLTQTYRDSSRSSTCQVSDTNGLADVEAGSALISTGNANYGGYGDTDLTCKEDGAGSGQPDLTRFALTLRVPQRARSLSFRTQIISSEDLSITSRQDRAAVYVGNSQYDISGSGANTNTSNPAVPYSVDVDGLTEVALSFAIEDGIDGRHDSALVISRLYFSQDPAHAGVTSLAPENVRLPTGTFRYSKNLLSVPGKGLPLEFTIHYSSRNTRTGALVQKWTHSFEWSISELRNGQLFVSTGDGGAVFFSKVNNSLYVETPYQVQPSTQEGRAGAGGRVEISLIGGATHYIYTDKSRTQYWFRRLDGSLTKSGYLVRIQDPNENRLEISYIRPKEPVSGRYYFEKYYIDTVTDTRKGTLHFYYQTDSYIRGDGVWLSKRLVSAPYADSAGREVAGAYPVYAPHYDCFNNVSLILAFVQQNSLETHFSHDCSGNLLTVTDPDGVVTTTNIYAGERVAWEIDGKGSEESYQYSPGMVVHTDRRGYATHRYFDAQDRLEGRTNSLGETWRYAHDDNGNISAQTDPLGNVTYATYDDVDNLLSSTDAEGNTSFFSYNAQNYLISETDPVGSTSRFDYDSRGNLVREVDALGLVTTYDYDARGQLLGTTDPLGHTTRYGYSTHGDLQTETDALGNTVTSEYDSLGRPVAVVDENGNPTSFAYDVNGNVLSKTLADGAIERYTYDGAGRLLSLQGPNGTTTTYEYSGTGKMLTVSDALGNTFRTSYTPTDQIATQSDELGRRTAFAYDAAGRQVLTTDALGNSVAASYDRAGNRTSITDPKGATTSYEYDANGRIVREVDPLGNAVANSYDARGLLQQVTNGRGQIAFYQYDAAGRITEKSFPTYSIRESYLDNDLPSRSQKLTYGAASTVSLGYDAASRLTSRQDQFGNRISYGYDAVGNVTSLTYSDGKTVEYRYDTRNRLSTVTDWDGNVTRYEYDLVGNVVFTSLPDGSTIENRYDVLGRLVEVHETAEDGSVIFRASYGYNATGLRVTADETFPLPPKRRFGATALSYDAANQIDQQDGQEFVYDRDGGLISGQIDRSVKTLEYDEESRLTRVGSDRYGYDPVGYRVESTIKGRVTRYVIDANAPGPRVLEEHDGAGNVVARYVYGVGLISRHDASGTTSVYHYDSRGSTVALSSLDGALTDRYAYSLYGEISARAGSSRNPFTFTGKYGVMDDGNGLYFMTNRYYEPRLMRFIQRDRVTSGNIMDPQSLNLHTYVRGNPVTFVDPGGDFVLTTIAVGIAVGLVTEVAWDYFVESDADLRGGDIDAYLDNNKVDLVVAGVLGAFSGVGAAGKIALKSKYALHVLKTATKAKKLEKWTRRMGKLGKLKKYKFEKFRFLKRMHKYPGTGAWTLSRRGYLKVAGASFTAVSGVKAFALEAVGLADDIDAGKDWLGSEVIEPALSGIRSTASSLYRKIASWF